MSESPCPMVRHPHVPSSLGEGSEGDNDDAGAAAPPTEGAVTDKDRFMLWWIDRVDDIR